MNEFVRELKESAAGLHDGIGGHADHCAELMEKAAKHIAELEENATAQSLALKAAKAMQQADTERADADAARLDFVEKMARQSRTGVSFDWCRHVYDGMVLERGYRVMWHHKLNDRADNIRDAIDQAMSNM